MANAILDKYTMPNWGAISENEPLTDEFIREHADHLHWGTMTIHGNQKFSQDIILEFADRIDMQWLLMFQKVEVPTLRELIKRKKIHKKFYWQYMCKDQKLTMDFMREFPKKLWWPLVIQYQYVTLKFIKEHTKYLDETGAWETVARRNNLTDEFVQEFEDKFFEYHGIWSLVSYTNKLSEKYRKKLLFKYLKNGGCTTIWVFVGHRHDWSEDFLRKHGGKIGWSDILRKQKNLSPKFRKEIEAKIKK
jgi:hypothetical protein